MKLADGYELDPAVPIDHLRPHPENPNDGDVGAIVDSIQTVGFYGVVTAQKPRNGRKNGRILAGEHRWRAAKAEGAESIPVSWLDVDDEEALRIVLGDNQIARLAMLDRAAQAAALEALTQTSLGLAGTGTDGDDLDSILADLERAEAGDGANGTKLSLEEKLDRYGDQEMRQLVLMYGRDDFQQLVAILAQARESLGVENNSEVIAALLRNWAA